jgi:hypothetical protein
MKKTLNELKSFELDKDMMHKLVGGATGTPDDSDDAVNGVTVFRRELLD